ncbi:hypothetical protein IEQ34_015831 [Dendrobium chrysotoxum]|uniref:Uncharacterized protein n=1 Tax=Dendrobium chrysotoxum TaxID=161865 RepID=A0AAV7GJ96_DENCH|nr:hypothetical protein IEQ34_015831 [Dendrobium chrysotoxum]
MKISKIIINKTSPHSHPHFICFCLVNEERERERKEERRREEAGFEPFFYHSCWKKYFVHSRYRYFEHFDLLILKFYQESVITFGYEIYDMYTFTVNLVKHGFLAYYRHTDEHNDNYLYFRSRERLADEAEDYLLRIENIFDSMQYPENRKVSLRTILIKLIVILIDESKQQGGKTSLGQITCVEVKIEKQSIILTLHTWMIFNERSLC